MYLFFDTETTGLPKNWNAPYTDVDNWPRLVQLAYILFDEAGEELECKDIIVKPEGYTIPTEASDIHGITHDIALQKGIPITEALSWFNQASNGAVEFVAHNIKFDRAIMTSEFHRAEYVEPFGTKTRTCTMTSTTKFCGLKNIRGLKWPKLQELHEKLFGYKFAEAHNALIDIKVTANCFWELKRMEII